MGEGRDAAELPSPRWLEVRIDFTPPPNPPPPSGGGGLLRPQPRETCRGNHLMPDPLLEIQNLNIAFDTARGEVRPVRDVSLDIYPGQTVAVVGESGCGKSVTAMSILRLIPSPPGKVLAGSV